MELETATEAAAAAAGMSQIPVAVALIADGLVTFLAFAFKVFLLWLTLRTVSRGTAAITVKALIFTTLGLATVYFATNPMLQTDELVAPLVVVILVGTLVCKRAFWISLERAFFTCLIVCPISIFVGDYSRRGLDELYPMRATVNMATAAAIDTYARNHSGNTNLPPSVGMLSALVRLTVTTNTTGPIGSTIGFLRAGLEAREYVERIRRQADMEARLSNLLAGGGTNLTNRKMELTAMKEFFGENTNARARPRPVIMNTYTGAHGYAAAYASAKAQIEEINRIASNNAAIVNFLSDAGTNVGDRAEEMAKLQRALIEEAERQGMDLSGTSAVNRAIVQQAVENVTSTSGPAANAKTSLVDALAANIMSTQQVESGSATSITETATLPEDAWKIASADVTGLALDVASHTVLHSAAAGEAAEPASGPPPSIPLMWTGYVAAPGCIDVGSVVLAVLSAVDQKPAAARAAAPPKPVNVYETMSREEHARWLAAQHSIKVTGVVHSKADISAMVNGAMVRGGDIHYVTYQGTNYAFRLRGLNRKGQCVWEPVLITNVAPVVSISF